MEPGLLVAPEQVIDPRQLQPDPGQARPDGEDCLEALRGLGQKAEPDLRAAEQEQPLDPLFLVLRLQPLQNIPRFTPPLCVHQHPHDLKDRNADRLRRGLRSNGGQGRCIGNSGGCGDRQKGRQNPHHDCRHRAVTGVRQWSCRPAIPSS